MIEGTCAAWIDALTFNRVWDQARDAPRIQKAFRALGAMSTDWPLPADLVRCLPAVEELPALPAKVVSDEVAQDNIRKIREMLRGTTWPVYDDDPVNP